MALPLMAAEGAPADAATAAESGEREANRRRRRRGGRGRNRGEAGPAEPGAPGEESSDELETDLGPDTEPSPDAAAAAAEHAPSRSGVEPARVAAPVPQPPQAREPIVVRPAALPRAEPYRLPITELNAVAASAGLEWVHSDAQKVQAVQAEIAATPAPARVPRAPKPPVVVDDGPLILVETKKDLAQIRLPFDTAG
jgi:ribonuclease E